MPIDAASGVYFELTGCGHPLMIGLPLMASHTAIFGAETAALHSGFLDRLTDKYQVCTIDYPAIGQSRDIAPEQLTADRVCADLLSVADAAGFDRFAFFGYSWSGAVGLQLASRTDRLSALAIGGWPPLGAPYAEIHAAARARIGKVELGAMAILRSADQYRQWDTFYASVAGWDEAAAISAMKMPKFIVFGADGDLVEAGNRVPIASAIRANRDALTGDGWDVHEIPGHGHNVIGHPELVVPLLRKFLDRHLS